MCLHPCCSRQFYTGNKGNSRKMCIHLCCRRQLYTGNKGTAAKCAYTLVVAEIVAKCTDTPVAACTSCAMAIRRSRTHISVLLRALVKKLYGNAQVFKPQSTIRPQNLQRLLLQLIRCSTSIQHAVSFTRTLTLSHVWKTRQKRTR